MGIDLLDTKVYGIIGEEGFSRITREFFSRVEKDDILSKIYPMDDLEGAEHRLREFLVFRFGGPDRYIRERGHPRLRARHIPFRIDQAARDRWVDLMNKSIDAAEIDDEAAGLLRRFMDPTATFMINQ